MLTHSAPPQLTATSQTNDQPKVDIESFIRQIGEILLENRKEVQAIANAIFELEKRVKDVTSNNEKASAVKKEDVERLSATVNLYFTDMVETFKKRVSSIEDNDAIRVTELLDVTTKLNEVSGQVYDIKFETAKQGKAVGVTGTSRWAPDTDGETSSDAIVEIERRLVSLRTTTS